MSVRTPILTTLSDTWANADGGARNAAANVPASIACLIEFISLLPLPWLFGHYLCGGDADHPGALLCLQSASGVNAPKGEPPGSTRTGKLVALQPLLRCVSRQTVKATP
jgi:hypothetical protein